MKPQRGGRRLILLFVLFISIIALAVLAVDRFYTRTVRKSEGFVLHRRLILRDILFDFLHCFAKAENKVRYMLTWGWLDLISSIPAVGPLRWGRAARSVRVLRVLRAFARPGFYAIYFGAATAKCGAGGVCSRHSLVVGVSSIAILELERAAGPEANLAHRRRRDVVVGRDDDDGRLRRSLPSNRAGELLPR